jgi:hypothetical protein
VGPFLYFFDGGFVFFRAKKVGAILYFLGGFLSFFGGFFVFSGLVFNFIPKKSDKFALPSIVLCRKVMKLTKSNF